MDQLKPNSIGEIHYRSVNMPLNYFGHIGYFQSWTVNLNFYDIISLILFVSIISALTNFPYLTYSLPLVVG